MTATLSTRSTGLGRVLIAVYGVLALAATGRSIYQILSEFETAPLAYSLSALASVVYILATIALLIPGSAWEKVAWATMSFELVGVIVVGILSIFDPELFPAKTVWSLFGRGYAFVPLVLPVLGLIWLMVQRRRAVAAARAAAPIRADGEVVA
ncbi:MAG: hypothetical protein ACOH1J_01135 [Microbacteriaceae bacterium]